MKKLIVNADDFGYAEGVNQRIIKAYREGIVTSTSLMVKGRSVDNAVKFIKDNPGLGKGLHFQIEDYDQDFLWNLKKVIASIFIENTKSEFLKQVEVFKKLIGKMPDHIDSHHHIHRSQRIYSFMRSYCEKNRIPMRGQVNIIGSFFGKPSIEKITVGYLIKRLRNLPGCYIISFIKL